MEVVVVVVFVGFNVGIPRTLGWFLGFEYYVQCFTGMLSLVGGLPA